MRILDFRDVRRPWTREPYPCYHKGPYLEEYFFDFYKNNLAKFDATGYTLMPIFWTTAYLDGVNVQPYIDALPKDRKWFCVSQHDDAIKERLPEGTVVFSAGGNAGGIPIPLVCSPMEPDILAFESINPCEKAMHLASFVGSATHPIRAQLAWQYENDRLFELKTKQWSFGVSEDQLREFVIATWDAKFGLCPRGYGAQSFRFYEVMQLNRVPVYIHDDTRWLPFHESINWDDFAVVIHAKDIPNLKEILLSITPQKYKMMLERGKEVYQDYFTLQGVSEQILNELQTRH